MKIIPGMYAIFWQFPNSRGGQFMADIYGDSPQHAVARFRDAFPSDRVCSVRDETGRFLAFK